jgi:uncharacterized RDD family membrane protein YckC
MNTSAQAPGTAIGQSVGIRAGATIIDIVIFWALSFLVAIATGETSGAGFSIGTLGSCLVGIIGIAYYVVMETMYGGTVGKLALGLKVVKEDGSALDWQTSIVRTLLRIVDGLFFYLIGAILVWTSPTNQRLGDKVAKTFVVKKDQVIGTSSSPTARF